MYTQNRFKDWYVGHAWASGLFPSSSGRNQESVSECINAWYGLQLFGTALGDERLRDLGRLMIATELRAAFHYWQILPPSSAAPSIYPDVFAANRLAAVVWSTKVDRYTWFGSQPEYAFGIQAMPLTPISELLLRPEWIDGSRSVWGTAASSASDQWRGILLMMSAVTKADDAWKDAQQLALFDNGNSLTNVLWWIATRGDPSAAAKTDATHSDLPDDSNPDGGGDFPAEPTDPGQSAGFGDGFSKLMVLLALISAVSFSCSPRLRARALQLYRRVTGSGVSGVDPTRLLGDEESASYLNMRA